MLKPSMLALGLSIVASGTSSIDTDRISMGEGRVSLVYHPSDFVESTGSLAIRRGDLGFRAIGRDGMTGYILGVTDNYAYLQAQPSVWGPRDLMLSTYGGGELVLDGFETEEGLNPGEGYLHVIIAGEPAVIPFYRP